MYSITATYLSLIAIRYLYSSFLCIYPIAYSRLSKNLEVFPCFFLSCDANARAKPAKMGYGPHCPQIFVLFYVLLVLCRSVYCLCALLPPGGYPTAVKKYIINRALNQQFPNIYPVLVTEILAIYVTRCNRDVL